MRYRIDDLAGRAGVTVDTVRYYQTRGLLPRPEREGRVAWYGEEHLARLRRIRDLKDKGLTLSAIELVVSGGLDPSDEALVDALTGPLPDEDPAGLLTLTQLAEQTGMSVTVLEALEREGLLVPRLHGGAPRYTHGDAKAVEAGLALLEAGVPLGELLDLARRHDQAMRGIAEQAVEIFLRFVRDPIRASAGDATEASERMIAAFQRMLPATSALVAHHFRRALLNAAQERLDREGEDVDVTSPGGAPSR